jgi:F-type H+-transporting ATPase subunit gamma
MTTPRPLPAEAMERFRNEEIDAVYLLYNEFKSVMAQKVTLRAGAADGVAQAASRWTSSSRRRQLEMLASLLPRYVEMRTVPRAGGIGRRRARRAHDRHGCGHIQRRDMIERLTLYMNRVRQASITKEIIEVVSGAAAAE